MKEKSQRNKIGNWHLVGKNSFSYKVVTMLKATGQWISYKITPMLGNPLSVTHICVYAYR